MPKLKKSNNAAEEKKTAWRTPVKLPSIAAAEPMKSLYGSGNDEKPAESQPKNAAPKIDFPISADEDPAKESSQNQKNSKSKLTSPENDKKNQISAKTDRAGAETLSSKPLAEIENSSVKVGESEFLKLLKTEKMDFYSLAEILRGSSMALYCVLYSESLAKGESRCQIRQSELMMRAGINNPATLYKQERWLTALHLISKSVRLGSHSGGSYAVRPLEILPLPNDILDQFGGYLTEIIG